MINKLKFIIIFLILSISLISAAPTIYGPTGLIEMPTAESLQYKEFNLGLDYNIHSGDPSGNAQDTYYYKFNLGTFRGFEVGVVGGSNPDEGVFVNIKYYLLSDNSRYPLSIAVGVENLTSNSQTAGYLVASKKFQGGFQGHFGFKAQFLPTKLESTVMLGGEYVINEEFSIACDMIGENSAYKFNVGLRYYMKEDLFLRVSFIDVTNSLNRGSYFNFGISWSSFID